MKTTRNILILTVVTVFALAPAVPAATVVCNGLESAGNGARLYYYEVTLLSFEWMQDFQVGTECVIPPHYTNWIQPVGWGPVLFGPPEPDADVKTPHGLFSPGPTGQDPQSVLWTGPQIMGPGTFFFGFDNEHRSHDVGWTVTGLALPPVENWGAPVGLGAGPVHGPIPEPASMALLGLGGLGVLIRRRRR